MILNALRSPHGVFHVAHSVVGGAVLVLGMQGYLNFDRLALLTGLWLTPLSLDNAYHAITRPARKARVLYTLIFVELVATVIALLYVSTIGQART